MRISRIIGIINPSKGPSKSTLTKLQAFLTKHRVHQTWYPSLDAGKRTLGRLNDLRKAQADLVLVCGGDGTMLQAAHRTLGSRIPILGINTGHLGFITSLSGKALIADMKKVLANQLRICRRVGLDITVINARGKIVAHQWALNDINLERGSNPRLIHLRLAIGGRDLIGYKCDGLVVSTPTGSTAYNLNAGGPIVSSESDVLILTPICPVGVSSRSSVVINNDEVITLHITDSTAMINVDGMVLRRVGPGDRVVVKTSTIRAPLAFLPEIDSYSLLSQKLNWGLMPQGM